MKKQIALALASIAIFNTGALATTASLENFTKVNTYQSGVFSDVEENAWYAESVISAYEFGLVNGILDGKFGVSDNITIAQSLAIACRLHSIYNGGDGKFEQGDTWYQVYVDYALNNSIIFGREFSDYNKTATRSEFAMILYSAVGEGGFDAINDVSSIPDVTVGMSNFDAIMTLYNAGILSGNDEYGTFYPDSYITRAEVSAVVSRVADTSARKNFVLSDITQPFVDIDTTYVSIDIGDVKPTSYTTYLLSGTPVWSSNNTSVCTVDQSGNITGVSKGTALITVNINGYKDAFTVAVTGVYTGSDKTNTDIFVGTEYYTKYYEYLDERDDLDISTYTYSDFIKDLLYGNISYPGNVVTPDDEDADVDADSSDEGTQAE